MDRVLLIVDDTPEVARGIRRCLKREIGSIVLASNAEEAELLLQQSPSPTLLLCDDDLGEGRERGSSLIRMWRRAYTSIRRAGLVTGGNPGAVEAGDGIDRVLNKPIDLEEVRSFLIG